MPVNVLIGIFAIIIALVLYSIGVWRCMRAKSMQPRSLSFLWAGFVFDVLATAMMVLQAGGLQNDLHTILALVAMFGMLAAALLGTWAYRQGQTKLSSLVARWVLAPWAVWAFVFVWGMISRGAARMH
jgi:uncharacterized repeat protein (TIGR03987 family)